MKHYGVFRSSFGFKDIVPFFLFIFFYYFFFWRGGGVGGVVIYYYPTILGNVPTFSKTLKFSPILKFLGSTLLVCYGYSKETSLNNNGTDLLRTSNKLHL